MNDYDEKKVAFTAGYLNALGSIVMVQRKYPQLRVNTKHPQIAKRLQRWWGGTFYGHPNHYTWAISNRPTLSRLFSEVLPLLTAERREYFEKRLFAVSQTAPDE